MHFGTRLRELRANSNVLQRQLAAELHIDTPMYSKIERGERKAKRDQVIAIARFLRVSENELLAIWLADQVLELVKDEDIAISAIKIAERDLIKQRKNPAND